MAEQKTVAAEHTKIAMPYARAVFALAQEKQQLKEAARDLNALSLVVSDQQIQKLLESPEVNAQQLSSIILDVASKALGSISDLSKRLVPLLAEAKRLVALPEIHRLFESFRAEAEKVVEVDITSASPMDDSLTQQFIQALKQRFGRDVQLTSNIDPKLIGGAIIRAGDLVIDGSVHGRLTKLAQALLV